MPPGRRIIKSYKRLTVMEMLQMILHDAVHVSQLILEVMGLLIIVCSSVKCFIGYFHGVPVRLMLAKHLALGLEFLMAGEILHTIIAEEVNELYVLGAIIVFRFILGWENSHEIKELEEEEKHLKQTEE